MVRPTILALALLSAAPAYADVPPPPTRPVHWHEQPEPMPEPPPEKAPLLLAFAALAGLVGAAALRTRRPAPLEVG